jgi:hypothetical protein
VGEEVCGWVSGVRQCTVPATAYRELATLAPAPAERATAYRPPVELVQVGCFNDADCSDGEVCGLFDGRQTCGPSITAAPHTVSFIQ